MRWVDYVYFAVSVRTTFGATDVAVVSRAVRRAVTANAIIAFVFNLGHRRVGIGAVRTGPSRLQSDRPQGQVQLGGRLSGPKRRPVRVSMRRRRWWMVFRWQSRHCATYVFDPPQSNHRSRVSSKVLRLSPSRSRSARGCQPRALGPHPAHGPAPGEPAHCRSRRRRRCPDAHSGPPVRPRGRPPGSGRKRNSWPPNDPVSPPPYPPCGTASWPHSPTGHRPPAVGGSTVLAQMIRAFADQHRVEIVQASGGMTKNLAAGHHRLAAQRFVRRGGIRLSGDAGTLPCVGTGSSGRGRRFDPAVGRKALGELQIRGPWITGSYYVRDGATTGSGAVSDFPERWAFRQRCRRQC